jgi:hypothetical protein
MSISKNVNVDVQNENATDHIDAEQAILTEQMLTEKMNEEELKNGTYKRRYGAFGCDHHRLVYARQHHRSFLEKEHKEHDATIGKIAAYLEWFLEDALCSNCIIAYDRGHEHRGESMYRYGFNVGFECVLEKVEKIVDRMNLPNKQENTAMTKEYFIEKIINTMHLRNKSAHATMTKEQLHENDCHYLNELDFPYLNDLDRRCPDEKYDDEKYDDIDIVDAELWWFFENGEILEEGSEICENCIVAYDRGCERGGEWQYRVGKNIGFESALEGLEKVVNSIDLTNESENVAMIKEALNKLITSLQKELKELKKYED